MRRLLPPCVLLAAIGLAVPGAAHGQAAPYASWRKLSSTNGWSPIVYDLETLRIVSFREHLYRYPAPGEETRELAYDMYLGLRAGGSSVWLTGRPLLEARYENGTGLIRTVQEHSGIRVTTTYTAPFGLEAHAFLVVAELENLGSHTNDVSLFTLHNFHTGGGPYRTSMERIRWDAALGAYLETSSAPDGMPGVLVARPLTPATHHTATPENPFPIVEQGLLFADVDDSGTTEDAVSGFQVDIAGGGVFARGAKTSFALVIARAAGGDAAGLVSAIDAYAGGDTPEVLLERERAGWSAWHATGLWPRSSTQEDREVALQSLAVLRMGQVREPGPPGGALLASLPPGKWDICWLRDALFAVDAFTLTGHHEEAEAALDFLIRGPFGDYQSYIGREYGLSVARYYGSGREESDFNLDGPNVELDGFGMFLESAAAHATTANRGAWLANNRAHIDGLVADVLVAFRDAETGLIAADSSIWESHWDNGGRQRWSFTSGRAARGLGDWADALDRFAGPNDARAAVYRAAAAELHQAMGVHLVDAATGALAASVEQLRAPGGSFVDAQVALFLRGDRFDPAGATGLATLDLLRDRLFLASTTRRGYRRNDDGDTYDRREWIVIDLGVQGALRQAGRTADADGLLDWVTGQAALNHQLLPELFHEDDARYFGEVPMVGFGAGAYVSALIARSGTEVPSFDGADSGTADVGAPSDAAAGRDAAEDAEPGAADAGAAPDSGAHAGADAAPSGSDASSSPPDAALLGPSTAACSCAETDRAPATSTAFVVLLLGAVAASRIYPRMRREIAQNQHRIRQHRLPRTRRSTCRGRARGRMFDVRFVPMTAEAEEKRPR